MLSFACPVCQSLVAFENSLCMHCGSELGFDRRAHALVVLDGAGPNSTGLRRCANSQLAVCNWLAEVNAPGGLCAACLLTQTRPGAGDETALASFALAEQAKRRLLFQLDDLGLPVPDRRQDPVHGLTFELLSSTVQPVVTGHASGVITIDLAEGEDGHREALRVRLDEPYRTMLGHFRHEIGHWYWDLLVDGTAELAAFRQLFGDERSDYDGAMAAHYNGDPDVDWQSRHVSSYASAHPWEDWAETFAHYLHVRDTLQTAASFGVWVVGPQARVGPTEQAALSSLPEDNLADFDQILASWLPLTYALNAMNRSMGKHDLYPFVLSPIVVEKLRFVHKLIWGALQPVSPAR